MGAPGLLSAGYYWGQPYGQQQYQQRHSSLSKLEHASRSQTMAVLQAGTTARMLRACKSSLLVQLCCLRCIVLWLLVVIVGRCHKALQQHLVLLGLLTCRADIHCAT